MRSSHNILAVIMARSKSKGLKNKNLKKIKNIPLLALPSIILKKSKLISKIIISTDSKKYGGIAKAYGIDFFYLRKKSLSGPNVPDHLVLRDALIQAEKYFKTKFNYIVSLPPTSPLRSRSIVEKSIRTIVKEKFDSLWTISKIDLKYHPDKQLVMEKGKLKYFTSKGKNIHYRQQLNTTFYRNGCAYVVKRKTLIENKTLLTKNSGCVIVKSPQISIDNKYDLEKARKIFSLSTMIK